MERVFVEFGNEVSREASIQRMLSHLQASLETAPEGSMDARMMAVLIDMMPGFVRALDRERGIFVGKRAKADQDVDEHLMVLSVPIVNMIGSIVLTLVPCTHVSPGGNHPCENCSRLRVALVKHTCENITNAAHRHVLQEIDIMAEVH